MTLTVINPGVQSLIQDGGRFGLARYGVPRSGAFDRHSWRTANTLVGNAVPQRYEPNPGPAAIELLLGGLRLQAERELVLAVAGAAESVTILDRDSDDKRSVAAGQAFVLTAGSRLHIRTPATGLRSYIAVSGGLVFDQTLDSRSTDTSSGLGPSALRTGQQVPVGSGGARHSVATGRQILASIPAGGDVTINARPGPHLDLIGDGSTALTHQDGWTVSPMSSRTGIRLIPHNLNVRIRSTAAKLPSEPTLCGAVQALPNGELVVLGPDGPTTGGYPVVAVMDEPEVDRLCQLRPGARLRLRVTSA